MLSKVNFYGLSDIRVEDVPRHWAKGTIAAADKLLKHRYSYLALGEIDLTDEINWNHEYKRGINTPLLFGPWMDYRDGELYGDFKYFWELPRLQHLITLAKAYYLTGREEYAGEVVRQIEGFIKQSPYLLGVNWIMPMEAAIRLVSICWITAFLKDYLGSNTVACNLIELMVKSHVDYVAKNYAAYSSANNHLVGEAAGVFIAAICFNRLENMNTYRQKAHDILCREILLQHHADGVNKEQTVHYQIFAFNFFLLAALLGKANNLDFPGQYWKMLEKSAEFLAAIADNHCIVPDIGDSDDGKTVILSETDCNPVQSILATSSVLFERSDFANMAETFDETSFWMLGNEGKDKFGTLNDGSVVPAKRFDRGGYYVLSSPNRTRAKVIFDCGPLGLGSISAHGHADSLSFLLSVNGLQYFTDPGTYTYMADSPFRNYFRSTAAHNTVVVDGRDQSQMAGPFLWGRKANSYLKEYTTNTQFDRVIGWHDGYLRLKDPVLHQRSITMNKQEWKVEINDYLQAIASHKIAVYFHLAPQCKVNRPERNRWCITNDNKTVELLTDAKLNSTLVNSSSDCVGGWVSSTYDRKVATNTLVCSGVFEGNQNFTTTIKIGY
ncbi:MAG: alginate lyase family protein [Planctomycetota bacterium]